MCTIRTKKGCVTVARWTQFVGLPQNASEIVKESKVIATFVGTEGLAGEPIRFRIFEDTRGLVRIEVLQAEIWSSGPVIFTKLIDTWGRTVVEWDQEEMKNYI